MVCLIMEKQVDETSPFSLAVNNLYIKHIVYPWIIFSTCFLLVLVILNSQKEATEPQLAKPILEDFDCLLF